MANQSQFSILVCGKTGIGKSSLINFVFGHDVCEVGDPGAFDGSFQAQTMTVEGHDINMNGVQVTIFDSPGLQDGTGNDEEYLDDMYQKCRDVNLVFYCHDMPSARWTNHEVNAIRLFTEKFGPTFWDKAVFVLTKANMVQPTKDVDEAGKKKHFQNWTINIAKVFQEEVRKQLQRVAQEQTQVSERVNSIPVVPTGSAAVQYLHGKHFIAELWVGCLERIQDQNLSEIFMKATNVEERMVTEEEINREGHSYGITVEGLKKAGSSIAGVVLPFGRIIRQLFPSQQPSSQQPPSQQPPSQQPPSRQPPSRPPPPDPKQSRSRPPPSQQLPSQQPSSQQPSSQQPSSQEPSSQEPSSQEPSSQQPSSQQPSSQQPSSQEPSSQEPPSQQPSSQQPSSQQPSSQEPSSQEPSSQEPPSQELPSQQPSSQEPSSQQPLEKPPQDQEPSKTKKPPTAPGIKARISQLKLSDEEVVRTRAQTLMTAPTVTVTVAQQEKESCSETYGTADTAIQMSTPTGPSLNERISNLGLGSGGEQVKRRPRSMVIDDSQGKTVDEDVVATQVRRRACSVGMRNSDNSIENQQLSIPTPVGRKSPKPRIPRPKPRPSKQHGSISNIEPTKQPLAHPTSQSIPVQKVTPDARPSTSPTQSCSPPSIPLPVPAYAQPFTYLPVESFTQSSTSEPQPDEPPDPESETVDPEASDPTPESHTQPFTHLPVESSTQSSTSEPQPDEPPDPESETVNPEASDPTPESHIQPFTHLPVESSTQSSTSEPQPDEPPDPESETVNPEASDPTPECQYPIIFSKEHTKRIEADIEKKWTKRGAFAGAVVGSVVPGLGTVVGAAVGAGIGKISGMMKKRFSRKK